MALSCRTRPTTQSHVRLARNRYAQGNENEQKTKTVTKSVFIMRKNAFLLIFLAFQMFGCNSDSHIEKLNAIDNYLNNITLSVESILKATPINGDVQNKRLDSLINVIDSLQVKWDLNIENIREKLSEEKINQLENESRNRMERIEQLLSRYYSEYDVIIEN